LINLPLNLNLHLNLDPDLNLNKDVFEYKLILQNADQRSGISDQDSTPSSNSRDWKKQRPIVHGRF